VIKFVDFSKICWQEKSVVDLTHTIVCPVPDDPNDNILETTDISDFSETSTLEEEDDNEMINIVSV
jgi:hypothetical protein